MKDGTIVRIINDDYDNGKNNTNNNDTVAL